MKMAIIATFATFISLAAFGQDHVVTNTPAEKKAMEKQNDEFKKQQSARPGEQTGYKNTKSYQAKSQEEKAKVDAEVERQKKVLDALRDEQKKKANAPKKE